MTTISYCSLLIYFNSKWKSRLTDAVPVVAKPVVDDEGVMEVVDEGADVVVDSRIVIVGVVVLEVAVLGAVEVV